MPARPGKRSRAGRFRRILRAVAADSLVLEREAGLLVLLSVADLLMTYALLRQGSPFYEANPIANWWFARWNIAGMTAFKFLLVGGVISICEYVERRRAPLGRFVLWIGCIGALYAFGTGARLFLRHAIP